MSAPLRSPTVVINNSYSQLLDFPEKEMSDLKNLLSVRLPYKGMIILNASHNALLRQLRGICMVVDTRGSMRPVFSHRGAIIRSKEEAKKLIKGRKARASGDWVKTQTLVDRRGFFASGLLYIVEDYLAKKTSMISTIKDMRKRPNSISGMFQMRLK